MFVAVGAFPAGYRRRLCHERHPTALSSSMYSFLNKKKLKFWEKIMTCLYPALLSGPGRPDLRHLLFIIPELINSLKVLTDAVPGISAVPLRHRHLLFTGL